MSKTHGMLATILWLQALSRHGRDVSVIGQSTSERRPVILI